MEEIRRERMPGKREASPGVEKQNLSPKALHDEGIATGQNDLCSAVSNGLIYL